jgi:hypothetical protein
MKFFVIAALLATASAADALAGAECKKDAKSGDATFCATGHVCDSAKKDGATASLVCIPDASCEKDKTFEDAAKATFTVTECTKKETTTDAKLAEGKTCTKADECAEKLKCGAPDGTEAKTCLKEADCDTEKDSKKIVCLSALRNAASVAVAAIAVAYSL